MEKVQFDSSSWPTYRSKFTVKADRVAPEGAALGSPVRFADEFGKVLKGKVGDYLVELDDGRLEFWAPDRFEREMQLEDEAAIELEAVPR